MEESLWCDEMNMVHILVAVTIHLGLLVAGHNLDTATTVILTLRVAIAWKARSSKNLNLFPHGLHREQGKCNHGVKEAACQFSTNAVSIP